MAKDHPGGVTDDLLRRRRRIQQEQELRRLREIHGERLAEALSPLVGRLLKVEEFESRSALPFSVCWPKRLEDAPGLVAAYVSKQRAEVITFCMASCLGELGGMFGIHDNAYLGLCGSSRIHISGLVAASELAGDAVVFYPAGIDGAILVDFYASNPGEPYSVLAQGSGLIERVQKCFE